MTFTPEHNASRPEPRYLLFGSSWLPDFLSEPQLFLRWDLVVHVAKDFPRTVRFLLPDKQVLPAKMDLLPAPRHVTFENRGRNGDIAHRVEAVPVDLKCERHKVRVGEKLLVILAYR